MKILLIKLKYYAFKLIIITFLLSNSMNHLNKNEKQYLDFSDFIHEIVDLFILIFQKARQEQLNPHDMTIMFRDKWELKLCEHVLSKLNKYMNFVKHFSLECSENGDNMMLETIELDKKMVIILVNILNTLHSNKFDVNGFTHFINEQIKNRNMHKYLIDNIKIILPDPPTSLPKIEQINDIIEHLKLFSCKTSTTHEKSGVDLIEF
jgi:hypothetical protein